MLMSTPREPRAASLRAEARLALPPRDDLVALLQRLGEVEGHELDVAQLRQAFGRRQTGSRGIEVALGEQLLAFLSDRVLHEQLRGVGMWSGCGDRDRIG